MSIEISLLNKLREPVRAGKTRPEAWRRQQLELLGNLLEENENKILKALNADLGKPANEALFEIIALKQEIKVANKNLSNWMSKKRVKIPIPLQPGEAIVEREPLGCVLIIGPWNYPFSLTLQPLISAVAAGNTAIIKPSEHAKYTSKLIAEVIPKYLPKDVVRVIEGDGSIAAQLTELPFDHIFFTGGGTIGKKVLLSAAENLTPVTLELGGKSPAIVLEDADIKVTSRRLIWGKNINSGQTCIAPDYLLVQESIKETLINEMICSIKQFYGENPLRSVNRGRIVNKYHFHRLEKLITSCKLKDQVIHGGEVDENSNLISPTLINIENIEDPLMRDEIFGPLLPILSINNLEEAINISKSLPRPLALYLFGGTSEQQQILLRETSSGSVCFNDVIMQAGIPELPFGGVGASGMGNYHGEAGFITFSHEKSILRRPFWLDFKMRYPPYDIDIKILKNLLG